MVRAFVAVAFVLLVTGLLTAQVPGRRADNRSFYSTKPELGLTINGRFNYVGSFDFTIPKFSNGQRYVYVDADAKKNVRRMLILQFEQVLADSSETYRYDFSKAEQIGKYRFRHNTFAFSNKAGRQENPNNEGELTVTFLEKKGYRLSDEWMASRFVAVPDAARKSEVIVFYLERIEGTGHRLADLYNGDDRTDLWQRLSVGLTSRSRSVFKIHD